MTISLPLPNAASPGPDQEVRWCPGCGDYSILNQFRSILSRLDIPRENIMLVAGMGCAGRLIHYVDAHGFQSAHGAAPAFATGLSVLRPDMQVWVILGDGEGMGEGCNHLLHALRRNCDLKILLFNNEVRGLSKGQHSPTSRIGTRTKSSPLGSTEVPLRAISLAIAAEATFVARTMDTDSEHLSATLVRAAQHKGSAFIEIYQNCKVYNDGAFEYASDRMTKADSVVYLVHSQPLLFGRAADKGIQFAGLTPRVVDVDGGNNTATLPWHFEDLEDNSWAFLLSSFMYPTLPECFGVFRQITRPVFGAETAMKSASEKTGFSLAHMLHCDNSWVVEPADSEHRSGS